MHCRVLTMIYAMLLIQKVQTRGSCDNFPCSKDSWRCPKCTAALMEAYKGIVQDLKVTHLLIDGKHPSLVENRSVLLGSNSLSLHAPTDCCIQLLTSVLVGKVYVSPSISLLLVQTSDVQSCGCDRSDSVKPQPVC